MIGVRLIAGILWILCYIAGMERFTVAAAYVLPYPVLDMLSYVKEERDW